jgi:hypothetical protein
MRADFLRNKRFTHEFFVWYSMTPADTPGVVFTFRAGRVD